MNQGTLNPPGPAGNSTPISGSFDTFAVPLGIGIDRLGQLISVPQNIRRATLSWSDRVFNYATAYVDPGQEFRVKLFFNPGTDVEVYSTRPGDPLLQPGPNSRSFDVTAALQALAGQQVHVLFEEQTTLFYLNVAVDNVRLLIETELACNAPGRQAGADFSAECAARRLPLFISTASGRAIPTRRRARTTTSFPTNGSRISERPPALARIGAQHRYDDAARQPSHHAEGDGPCGRSSIPTKKRLPWWTRRRPS